MSDVPFHMTRMGARFIEHTVPELVRQIERLNENLERIINLRVVDPHQPKEGDSDDPESRTEEGTQPPHA